MCGISALFSKVETNLSEWIQPMTCLVKHRGPDDEGYALVDDNETIFFLGGEGTAPDCYNKNIPQRPSGKIDSFRNKKVLAAIGHRRLSIIDLSPSGHQPLISTDGRYLMVYNGEVYNYLELRRRLEGLGHCFYSHSDSEVVLAAYLQWAEQALSLFNGMFAIVIYDTRKKRIFAARDRFGIKPLYYWISPLGFVAFASEIKQFSCLPGWEPRINYQKAYDFLNWGIGDHSSETMFQDVRQLTGGSFFYVSPLSLEEEIKHHNWYELRPNGGGLSYPEACSKFYELLRDSIQLRLRSDVPVGTGLSGGLDSSSIVCIVNEELRRKNIQELQNTFSACSHDPKYDERPFINEVVNKTRVNDHYVFPDINTLFDSLDCLSWHQDEPFSSTSIFMEWEVFKLVSTTNVKVTLDGHGADELLLGYHYFFSAYWATMFKQGNWKRLLHELSSANQLHGYSWKHFFFRTANVLVSDIFKQNKPQMFRNRIAQADWLESERFGIKDVDPVAMLNGRSMNLQLKSKVNIERTSVPIQLHWADRDSMAHSIESRVPFLDYRLVEFVLGCPDSYKLRNGITKRILRDSLQAVLPEKISCRLDKMGFVSPEEIWVRKQKPDVFKNAVRESVDGSKGLLNKKAISLCDRIINGALPFNTVVWRIISFGTWLERFSVNT